MGTPRFTDKMRRFCEEYLVDLNASAAARRAGYSDSEATRHIASDLLEKPMVREEIARLQAERSERTAITADAVLRQWWEIATAEANDLVQVRRGACPSCYGDDVPGTTLDPSPLCETCGGEGLARVHALDSRHLKGKARLLYAGAKQTRDGGIEIKMRDQDAALANVAKHLGMFSERLVHSGNVTVNAVSYAQPTEDET